jgi:hypothetical protein
MSDLIERLRKNAEDHLQVANDCDCNPEATRNYHHYRDDLEAADRIAELEQEITIEKSKQF